jgi:hypothetical protein
VPSQITTGAGDFAAGAAGDSCCARVATGQKQKTAAVHATVTVPRATRKLTKFRFCWVTAWRDDIQAPFKLGQFVAVGVSGLFRLDARSLNRVASHPSASGGVLKYGAPSAFWYFSPIQGLGRNVQDSVFVCGARLILNYEYAWRQVSCSRHVGGSFVLSIRM